MAAEAAAAGKKNDDDESSSSEEEKSDEDDDNKEDDEESENNQSPDKKQDPTLNTSPTKASTDPQLEMSKEATQGNLVAIEKPLPNSQQDMDKEWPGNK